MLFRYYCSSKRPSEMIRLNGIKHIVDYEEPVKLDNGKRIYGYIDYDYQRAEYEVIQLGLLPIQGKSITD